MHSTDQSFTVRRLERDARQAFEAALVASGVPLSVYWTRAWADAFSDDAAFYAVSAGTSPRLGLAVSRAPSRALRGHWLWRVRQFNAETDPAIVSATIGHLAAQARGDARVLRLSVDLFSRDEAARTEAGRQLEALGFHRVAAPRDYARTLVLDLPASLDVLWESAGYAAVRRKVRVVQRAPLDVRVIDDPSLADRMGALLDQTFARTGSSTTRPDFPAIMRLGQLAPDASRLVGMFRTDVTGPDALVAFAWGTRHGAYAVYDVAASSRESSVRKYPLAYALMWDLIRWSHASGASWFDFGGVTMGSQHDGDPLGGISEFKRAFSEDVATVRTEWAYEPHALRAWVARGVSEMAAALQRRRRPAGSRSATAASAPDGGRDSAPNDAVEQAPSGPQP